MKPSWRADILAALTVTFLGIPQGLAYAMIADLPPVVGLYAATIPAILGSLFRSSRHVVSGPTNALSLLVGGVVAALAVTHGASPVDVALALALGVGVIQLTAGALRLGTLVDFISAPVVLGYITGAAVLIAVGQLGNLTGTDMERGDIIHRVASWWAGLGGLHPATLGVGLGSFVLILFMRHTRPTWPSALIAVVLATLASFVFDLRGMGVGVVADLSVVEASFPPLTMPDPSLALAVLPVAVAATVLSLVESTAVARAIAANTGDRLDCSKEFVGQGLSNLSAAFCGGYPVSGSLSRSTLNWKSGAETRWAGAFSGILVLLLLVLAGPVVNIVPLAALAGLLFVVAWDLIDTAGIRSSLASGKGDVLAFSLTVLGTWVLSLDRAIYLGVVISLGWVLWRTRDLRLWRLRELRSVEEGHADPSIRVLRVAGRLHFVAAGGLRDAIDRAVAREGVRTLVVDLAKTQGLDLTARQVLAQVADRLRTEGRSLILVGLDKDECARFRAVGLADAVGADNFLDRTDEVPQSVG